ncbi:hypothetical protein [Nocardia seriolae]|uniref:hypothetical protein n=1 Tax=Nocardia seriolae TaxID=37332 RepID=UPI001E643DEE|nr:hypothetical protein [Nocardia seriolae]
MTRIGSGAEKACTRSNSAFPAQSASRLAAISAIRSRRPATSGGENSRLITERSRVCRGGSRNTSQFSTIVRSAECRPETMGAADPLSGARRPNVRSDSTAATAS